MFYECNNLTSVTIGSGVTSIRGMTFKPCASLISITVIEGNTTYHSAGNCIIETASKTLIAGCKTSEIPNDGSVTSIGDYAFSSCSGLTSITIPDSVTDIGECAFSNCSDLTSITIGSGVINIANHICEGSNNITEVIIDSETIAENGSFHNYNLTNVSKVYVKEKEGLTVGDYITGSFTETTSDKEGYVLYTK